MEAESLREQGTGRQEAPPGLAAPCVWWALVRAQALAPVPNSQYSGASAQRCAARRRGTHMQQEQVARSALPMRYVARWSRQNV